MIQDVSRERDREGKEKTQNGNVTIDVQKLGLEVLFSCIYRYIYVCHSQHIEQMKYCVLLYIFHLCFL